MNKEKLFYFLTLPEDRVPYWHISGIQELSVDTLDLRGADFFPQLSGKPGGPLLGTSSLTSSPNWFTQYALQIGLCTFATI